MHPARAALLELKMYDDDVCVCVCVCVCMCVCVCVCEGTAGV